MMSIVLWSFVGLCFVFGFWGCFVTRVNGPLFVLIGLLIAKFGLGINTVGWLPLSIVAVMLIINLFASKWVKNKIKDMQEFGKLASWGTTIGSIIGLVIGWRLLTQVSDSVMIAILSLLLVLVILPYIFAFLGELAQKKVVSIASKGAGAATLVHAVTTGLKLLVFGLSLYFTFKK